MSGPILDYCVLDAPNQLERLRMDVRHKARLVTTDTRAGFLHPLRRKKQRIALYAFKYLVRIGLPLPAFCINEGVSEWQDGTLRLFQTICLPQQRSPGSFAGRGHNSHPGCCAGYRCNFGSRCRHCVFVCERTDCPAGAPDKNGDLWHGMAF